MKTFYLYENGSPSGPFSINELSLKRITFETPIWKEGMKEWLSAGKFPELNSVILKTPPSSQNTYHDRPTAFMTATEKTGFKIGKALGWAGLFIMITLLLVDYNISTQSKEKSSSNYVESARTKTPEEIKAELLLSEQQNPAKYFNGSYKNWENLLGERVIEMNFKNNATLAGFKDVVVRVTFYSKTGTEIGSREFTWFEYFKPGQTQTHRIRTFAPGGTKDVSVEISSATPM
jgi:hypothetical protein